MLEVHMAKRKIRKWLQFLLRLTRKKHREQTIGDNSHLPRFPLFQKLPAELRLKIWRHSFPPATKIRIRHNKPIGVDPYILETYRESSIPHLYVNHESRSEALKHFHLFLFPTEFQRRALYINPETDILRFSLHYPWTPTPSSLPKHMCKETVHRIRHVEAHLTCRLPFGREDRQLGIFKHFKGLEQLDFYYHCYSDQEPPQKSHDCVKGFFERKYARDSTRTMPRIDWYNILFCP